MISRAGRCPLRLRLSKRRACAPSQAPVRRRYGQRLCGAGVAATSFAAYPAPPARPCAGRRVTRGQGDRHRAGRARSVTTETPAAPLRHGRRHASASATACYRPAGQPRFAVLRERAFDDRLGAFQTDFRLTASENRWRAEDVEGDGQDSRSETRATGETGLRMEVARDGAGRPSRLPEADLLRMEAGFSRAFPEAGAKLVGRAAANRLHHAECAAGPQTPASPTLGRPSASPHRRRAARQGAGGDACAAGKRATPRRRSRETRLHRQPPVSGRRGACGSVVRGGAVLFGHGNDAGGKVHS